MQQLKKRYAIQLFIHNSMTDQNITVGKCINIDSDNKKCTTVFHKF